MRSRLDFRRGNLQDLYGVSAIVLVAAIGICLAFQGWNSRLMNIDHVNFIDAADKLLTDGTLPNRGDVSSYWVFNTPGTAWLMVPGMLFFDDPRLYEAIGSAGLYLGTLIGVYLLARTCFGLRCAYLSVLLYGLSRNGLFFAGSLWSIGHPFFYVWMVYFGLIWVRRNNANYLAAALVTWSLGMFVDMVIAPALFALPAMWIVYRPRIRIVPLLMAGLISSAIWYPFLKFERGRDFADLKSLVGRTRLRPANYKASWCAPDLVVQRLTETAAVTGGELPSAELHAAAAQSSSSQPVSWPALLSRQIRLRVMTFKEGLILNFDQMTWTPLAAGPLVLLALAALMIVALQGSSGILVTRHDWIWHRWMPRVALAFLILPALANEMVVARVLSANGTLQRSTVWEIRAVQTAVALIGVVLLWRRRPIAELCRRVAARLNERRHDRPGSNRQVFALGLVVPWIVLLLVVEGGNASRYYWLWPLQLVLIVAAVTDVPQQLGWPRSVAWFGQICVTLALLTHPWVISPVQSWVRSGWSGPRANDIQAVDYIAGRVRAHGGNRIALGYQTYFLEFMPAMNIVEPRYKVGAELDLFLEHRYGIYNSDRCAEGFSAADEYRIVQEPPKLVQTANAPMSWLPLGGEVKTYDLDQYFAIPLDPGFRMLREFGEFQVFYRSSR